MTEIPVFRGRRAVRSTVILLMFAGWAWTPGAAAAQSVAELGVVAPADAYVGGVRAEKAVRSRWRLEQGGRLLTFRLGDPPAGRPAFWRPVEAALSTWSSVDGMPFWFEPARENATADLEFEWVAGFATAKAGLTRRQLDDDGAIRRAVVTLARDHANGFAISDAFLSFVAIHEIGHALGLPHSDAPGDAMYPGSRNAVLSSRDVASLRNLYDLDLAGGSP